MKIIDPWIEVEDFDAKRIMQNLERACRTCYRSEDKITDTSYETLLKNCVNRGHESILEHEKITIRMCCDVGVYKDLTRHRIASFSIESTRYCNYSKDKFSNNIKFIKPVFYKDSWTEAEYEGSSYDEDEHRTYLWYSAMEDIEEKYMRMSQIEGTTPDILRMLLPHSTAAEVTMTANIREWKHILELRCSKMTHPAVRQLMIPLLLKFKQEMPVIFEDIPYDEGFPKEKYAKIK